MFVKCGKYDCPYMGNHGYCSVTACVQLQTVMNIEPEYERVEGLYANMDWFPRTNYDHIRSMTDEEFAEWFRGWVDCPCPVDDGICEMSNGCGEAILYWLRQEYKDEKEAGNN